MAVVKYPHRRVHPFEITRGASSSNFNISPSAQINAPGEKAFSLVQVPRAHDGKSVTKIHLPLYSIGTNTAKALVETVDASGNPTGTLYSPGNSTVNFTFTNSSYHWRSLTFDGSFAITAGDYLGAGVEILTGTANTYLCKISGINGTPHPGFAQSRHYTTSWGRSIHHYGVIIEFSDGTMWPLDGSGMPSKSGINTAFDANDNPNHRGNRFRLLEDLEFDCFYFHRPTTSADYKVKLYGPSGLLKEATMDESLYFNDWYPTFLECDGAPVVLEKDTDYVVCWAPISTTLTMNPIVQTMESQALKDGGAFKDISEAKAHNPTDVTDFTLDHTKLMSIWPAFSGVDIPAGGGGGGVIAHPLYG